MLAYCLARTVNEKPSSWVIVNGELDIYPSYTKGYEVAEQSENPKLDLTDAWEVSMYEELVQW